jgi:hypothetical protein
MKGKELIFALMTVFVSGCTGTNKDGDVEKTICFDPDENIKLYDFNQIINNQINVML